MEYKLLDKITKRLIGSPINFGNDFNLILSEKYYKQFAKEITHKYNLEGKTEYISTIDPEHSKYVTGIKAYHYMGYKVNIIVIQGTKTWALSPVNKNELRYEPNTDEDNS